MAAASVVPPMIFHNDAVPLVVKGAGTDRDDTFAAMVPDAAKPDVRQRDTGTAYGSSRPAQEFTASRNSSQPPSGVSTKAKAGRGNASPGAAASRALGRPVSAPSGNTPSSAASGPAVASASAALSPTNPPPAASFAGSASTAPPGSTANGPAIPGPPSPAVVDGTQPAAAATAEMAAAPLPASAAANSPGPASAGAPAAANALPVQAESGSPEAEAGPATGVSPELATDPAAVAQTPTAQTPAGRTLTAQTPGQAPAPLPSPSVSSPGSPQTTSPSSSSGPDTAATGQSQPTATETSPAAIAAAATSHQAAISSGNPTTTSSSDAVGQASTIIISVGQTGGQDPASATADDAAAEDDAAISTPEASPLPALVRNAAPPPVFVALGSETQAQDEGTSQSSSIPAVHADATTQPDPGAFAILPAAPAPAVTPTVGEVATHAAIPSAQLVSEQTHTLLAVRVGRAVQDGTSTLSVELHPAELGKVEVRLSFHPDGVGVQMTVDRRETFDAFTRDRVALEKQFSQAGIDLGSNGLDLRFGQQSGQSTPRETSAASRFVAVVQQPASGGQPARATVQSGLIDILA
jgi:flagellar hook-length control protein FliK